MTAFPASNTKEPVRAAHEVLARYWNRRFPVDPVMIARRCGIDVFGRGGPDDPAFRFSGYFHRSRGQPVIEINVHEPLPRQRFTAAHELGHCFLGHDHTPRDVGAFYSSKHPREQAANRFATALLLPEHYVRHYFVHAPAETLADLAAYFGVSADAMGHRLIHLHLV